MYLLQKFIVPDEYKRASLVAQMVKNLPTMQEMQVWPLGQEDPLEKGIATHSSILAWRISSTEEPGGLQSMGLQRVGHDWSDLAVAGSSIFAWNSPGKNTGVGSYSHLQGIFPTQGSNLGLLSCRQILYHLSHQGSPIIDASICYVWKLLREKIIRVFIKIKNCFLFL